MHGTCDFWELSKKPLLLFQLFERYITRYTVFNRVYGIRSNIRIVYTDIYGEKPNLYPYTSERQNKGYVATLAENDYLFGEM